MFLRKHPALPVCLLVLAVLFSLSGCQSHRSTLKNLSKALGIDVTGGEVIAETDTHGGFHGDGVLFVRLQWADQSCLETIQEQTDWHACPLSDRLRSLLDSVSSMKGADQAGPMADVRNGYVFFLDRQADSGMEHDDRNVLERASYNFVLAVYDADTDILWFLEVDT